MIQHTAADFAILAPVGLQDHAHSEEIYYNSSATFTDEELIHMIRYAKSKGIRVGLKPTVNCKNGVWRAYISFFEKDVPCEPKWSRWFASYTNFQTHYAKIAQEEQCELFIAGCEMVMTEHGENLSGGQRQRISIARAFLRDPKILILDEATSALDSFSEKKIQDSIQKLVKGRTTLIVAHRLSTIRQADRIAVIGNGTILECGSYEELMEKKGAFYQMEKL